MFVNGSVAHYRFSRTNEAHAMLVKPTKPMRDKAVEAGRYESKLWHGKDDPKIQILTVEGLLSGKERVDAPSQANPLTKAQRHAMPDKQPAPI